MPGPTKFDISKTTLRMMPTKAGGWDAAIVADRNTVFMGGGTSYVAALEDLIRDVRSKSRNVGQARRLVVSEVAKALLDGPTTSAPRE